MSPSKKDTTDTTLLGVEYIPFLSQISRGHRWTGSQKLFCWYRGCLVHTLPTLPLCEVSSDQNPYDIPLYWLVKGSFQWLIIIPLQLGSMIPNIKQPTGVKWLTAKMRTSMRFFWLAASARSPSSPWVQIFQTRRAFRGVKGGASLPFPYEQTC